MEEGAALRAGGGRGKGSGPGKSGRGHSKAGRQPGGAARGRGGPKGPPGRRWQAKDQHAVPPPADTGAGLA
eukprot:8815884-Alexandrium_andersonii.AAC.1